MKKLLTTSCLSLLSLMALGQVQIDRQIQMTGATAGDRRITGVSNAADVTPASTDAVNINTIQRNYLSYAAGTFAAGTYTVTLTPAITSYWEGMIVTFKASAANTGATNLNVNAQGAVAITKAGGAALAANDIQANQIVTVIYNTTGPRFEIIGSLGIDGWKLRGNTGTNSANDYVGTTDGQALTFRTNNTARFRIANGNQVFALADGSAAAPFYSWEASTGLGLFRPAANALGFSTNGAERMRILANGQVVVNNTTAITGDIFSSYAGAGAYAVNGYATTGAGVFGDATGANGLGVWGSSNQATGLGVFGSNIATNGTAIQGVANSGNATGVFGSTSSTTNNATGVYGQAIGTSGVIRGVWGLTNSTSNASTGIFGQALGTTGQTYAVRGQNSSTTNAASGLVGEALGTTGSSFGVWGIRASPTGVGVVGRSGGGSSFYLVNSGGSFSAETSGANTGTGVYGRAAGNQAVGIMGITDRTSTQEGVAVMGGDASGTYYLVGLSVGGSFSGGRIGVYGRADNNTPNTNRFGGYFYADVGGGEYAYVGGRTATNVDRKIEGTGTVNTVVKDINNNLVVMSAPEAPENLFMDYGVGQLVNGKAKISLDPNFSKNIVVNAKHPLRVVVQLEGDCNGVYVTNKTQNGFEVVELKGGTSNVPFTYQVIANRADEVDSNGITIPYSSERFAPAIGPMPAAKVTLKAEGKALAIETPTQDNKRLQMSSNPEMKKKENIQKEY